MTYWTITYGGVEQAISSWGITEYSVDIVCRGTDTLQLTTSELFDPVARQFTYEQPMVLQRDRVLTGSTWSSGSIVFQGFVGNPKMTADGSHQGISYPVYGAWWKLERLQFKQTRQVFNGYVVPTDPYSGLNPLATVFIAETFLGEDPTEAQWTGAQAITEILNFANECWNPTKRGATSGRDNTQDLLTIGTIDCGQVFPKTRASTLSCAEAITQILRGFFPATVPWFNYATTPPTLNIRDQSNLT